MKLPSLSVLLALLCAACLSGDAQAITFSDGEFPPGDWEILTVEIGEGGWITAEQIPEGGNPGSYRSVTCFVNEPGDEPARVFGIHLKHGATYDPQVHGPVEAFSYSEDAMAIDAFGQGQGTGPAIIQDGQVFVVRGYVTGVPATWETIAITGLTAEEFSLLTSAGFDDTVHPDFSAVAAPFDVGFMRGNGSPAQGDSYETTVGIDNWRVQIDGVVPSATRTWGELKAKFR